MADRLYAVDDPANLANPGSKPLPGTSSRMTLPPVNVTADLSPRAQTVAFWSAKGAPLHVAQGIADRVNAESGFRPTVEGDKGTSIGLYQHHADRKARLMAQPNWQNPMTQHQFAYSEVTGGDAIATKHWNEIVAAPDRATAAKLWDRYFERSAGGRGSANPGGGGRRMTGRLGGMGPRVPEELPETAAGRAVAPRAAPPVPPPPQPQQQAEAVPPPAPPAFPMPSPIRGAMVQPVGPGLAAPALAGGYKDALAAILGGQRRPFGSIFGQ